MAELTPRRQVLAALRGEKLSRPPFTVYECFVGPGTRERTLREKGMCVIYRTTSYRLKWSDADVRDVYWDDASGRRLHRREYRTPVGTLTSLKAVGRNTEWTLEYPFKSPDDYKALRWLYSHVLVEDASDEAARLQDELGEDYAVRDCLPLEPLQGMISGEWMSPEDFCYEWIDNRDEIEFLYAEAVKTNRACIRICANGPLDFVNYGGNVVPQLIGPKTFREYYMPNYQEAAEALHKTGKFLGCHYDGDNTPFMDLLRETALDYIEAYDPGISPPLEDAFRALPEQALWINWPSPWHVQPAEEITRRTRGLVEAARGRDRFLIGVTEDMPYDRRWEILEAIQAGIRES